MATKNPLVSVYIPPDLEARLAAFQLERGIESTKAGGISSKAVLTALREFFEGGGKTPLNDEEKQLLGELLGKLKA